MRHSRLSEIDLAEALNIPPGPALEAAMREYNAGGGFWSYDPARASTSDILGASPPLFDVTPVPWPQLSDQIRAACKHSDVQIEANLEVSKLLFDAVRDRKWSATKESMGHLSIGFDEGVRYWNDVILFDNNGPFIPFFDHRRRSKLENTEVRHIVFSLQHIGVRERYPDLCEVRLAIIRFPPTRSSRRLEVYFHDGSELLSYEDLDSRVRVVYETWARVSDDRTNARRASGGGSTPLGF